MRSLKLLAGASALCVAACASTEDVRALRRPELPPTYVAIADRDTPLHENVAVFEIVGAPEFVLFDAGAVITTRPTRHAVIHMLEDWLDDADMLADNLREADYLLTLSFVDLHGPDVIPFSDKDADATVHYVLERRMCRQLRQPNCVAFEGTYQAHLQARMPGVTPEMTRAAIAGGIIGAALGGEIADDNAVAARWDGAASGAALGFIAAAPTGRRVEHWDDTNAPGAFDGTLRRQQAVTGMMRQHFNRFLFALDDADLINVREAVTCEDLNSENIGVGIITTTSTQIAYDCPIGHTRPITR
ncbi:MAG TPA: hypothetical protein VM915_03275 [Verrucomicrobiae bacterium]|nr:hypothetical protein [Verrucomicrobiae bacterium]